MKKEILYILKNDVRCSYSIDIFTGHSKFDFKLNLSDGYQYYAIIFKYFSEFGADYLAKILDNNEMFKSIIDYIKCDEENTFLGLDTFLASVAISLDKKIHSMTDTKDSILEYVNRTKGI